MSALVIMEVREGLTPHQRGADGFETCSYCGNNWLIEQRGRVGFREPHEGSCPWYVLRDVAEANGFPQFMYHIRVIG